MMATPPCATMWANAQATPINFHANVEKLQSLKEHYPASGNHARQLWKEAAAKGKVEEFDEFDDQAPVEKAERYTFDPVTGEWHSDIVIVKMEKQSFAKGALRLCYRMKKVSNWVTGHHHLWDTASCFVAKRYMKPVDDAIYKADVEMQMVAKHLGELYDLRHPPKSVDFIQTWIFRLIDRESQEIFAVERFIHGEYVKYNNNCGYVDHDQVRLTPQTFSHFSYEVSGGDMLVCDIQGVGDIYTDPQIHTAEGTRFGEGNLGPNGIALFFQSHECSPLCRLLGLQSFDMLREKSSWFLRAAADNMTHIGRRKSLKMLEKHLSRPEVEEPVLSEQERCDGIVLPWQEPTKHSFYGAVHFALAMLYTQGRQAITVDPAQPTQPQQAPQSSDATASLHHLQLAAFMRHPQAAWICAQVFAHDSSHLSYIDSYAIPIHAAQPTLAVAYLKVAAAEGIGAAAMELAMRYEIGADVPVDWQAAVQQWQNALSSTRGNCEEDGGGALLVGDTLPVHEVLSRMALLLLLGKCGVNGMGESPESAQSMAVGLWEEAGQYAEEMGAYKTADKYRRLSEEGLEMLPPWPVMCGDRKRIVAGEKEEGDEEDALTKAHLLKWIQESCRERTCQSAAALEWLSSIHMDGADLHALRHHVSWEQCRQAWLDCADRLDAWIAPGYLQQVRGDRNRL